MCPVRGWPAEAGISPGRSRHGAGGVCPGGERRSVQSPRLAAAAAAGAGDDAALLPPLPAARTGEHGYRRPSTWCGCWCCSSPAALHRQICHCAGRMTADNSASQTVQAESQLVLTEPALAAAVGRGRRQQRRCRAAAGRVKHFGVFTSTSPALSLRRRRQLCSSQSSSVVSRRAVGWCSAHAAVLSSHLAPSPACSPTAHCRRVLLWLGRPRGRSRSTPRPGHQPRRHGCWPPLRADRERVKTEHQPAAQLSSAHNLIPRGFKENRRATL